MPVVVVSDLTMDGADTLRSPVAMASCMRRNGQ